MFFNVQGEGRKNPAPLPSSVDETDRPTQEEEEGPPKIAPLPAQVRKREEETHDSPRPFSLPHIPG